MAKIVAILSNPIKDNNTDKLVDSIINGAVEMSTCEVYVHSLCECKYAHGCRRCMKCKETGKCA